MAGQKQTSRNNAVRTHLEYASAKGVFFRADCIKMLPGIKSDTIDLVFVDPPFNLGKSYEGGHYNDSMQTETYRTWCHNWLLELTRVLRPGGALFLYHWPYWLMQLGNWLNTLPNLQYKSWIAMKMKSGFPIRGRLHPAHYALLYYVKTGQKAVFNVVRHKTPICRHCGKLIRDYGGYRKKFERFEDEDGIPWIQISDFWEDTRPARQDKARTNTINELPLHISERAILLSSKPGDVVLDIFGGGGSTYHAAELHDRKWIGCEVGDPTPTLKRLVTFSKGRVQSPPAKIRNCFTPSFWKAQVESVDLANLTKAVATISPAESVIASLEDYQAKSKDIGY